MRVEVRFEVDDATLAALRMFAEYLDMSLEEYIEDYLEWEFSPNERGESVAKPAKERAKRSAQKDRGLS